MYKRQHINNVDGVDVYSFIWKGNSLQLKPSCTSQSIWQKRKNESQRNHKVVIQRNQKSNQHTDGVYLLDSLMGDFPLRVENCM